MQVPQPDTILAIQADGTVAGLHTGDATIDPDTISALEQYAAKVWHCAAAVPASGLEVRLSWQSLLSSKL